MPSPDSLLGAPGIDNGFGPVDPDIGVKDIALLHLSVKPAKILPFGAAVLRWEVDAPPTVQITINDEAGPQSGTRVVRPTYSTTYRVLAKRGPRATELGRVDLEVDRSACTTTEFLNPASLIAANIDQAIAMRTDVSIAVPTRVTFQPNRVTCELFLSGAKGSAIQVKASCGLTVSDGRVAATASQVSADVQIPWYIWMIPGGMIGAAIAKDAAIEKATAAGFAVINGVVRVVEGYWHPADGMARHHIRVGPSEDAGGVLETTDCPTTPLDQLAEFAENPIING